MSHRNSKDRLLDIMESAERIEQYVNGCNYEQFTENFMIQDAIIRNLEIIGEAAKNLPLEIIDANPKIEWRQIMRMRDLLAHAYHKVLLYTVWDAAVNKVPELKEEIKKILYKK